MHSLHHSAYVPVKKVYIFFKNIVFYATFNKFYTSKQRNRLLDKHGTCDKCISHASALGAIRTAKAVYVCIGHTIRNVKNEEKNIEKISSKNVSNK